MTRYRGGTYSHTVEKIVFADGATARTDLIRLNPNIEAYSLDFTGHAPTRPSRYRAGAWSAVPNLRARAFEAEIDWIVRNSYPVLGTVELSRRVRAAGIGLGAGNLAEHEAIAATQAAIWFFTNGLELDNRPRNVPVARRRTADGLVFEFDGEPQLGGYTVELESDSAVSLLLQKSSDGRQWEDVAASGLNLEAGRGRHRRALGVGTTVSSARPGRTGRGYRFYRLVVVADRGATVDLGDVTFWLNGAAAFANPERVVHLYNYLVAGANAARRVTVPVAISAERAVVDGDLVGPFTLQATDRAALTLSAGDVVDRNGIALRDAVAPGDEFYLRTGVDTETATLTVHVPASTDGFGGRVLTGVAHDAANSSLTPVVLAAPAQHEVRFDVTWASAQARRTA